MSWGFALALGVALGCTRQGVERLEVAGNVTFRGKPVPKGRIDFVPDRTRGNKGPAGFAEIESGRFDTRQTGRGAVPGPQVAVIQGFDGQRGDVPGMLNGNPLFETRRVPTEIRLDELEYDFDISTDKR